MADYNLVRTMKAMPVGSVMPWVGALTSIPKGWLLCNNSELLASDFPLLARVLRNSYGGVGFGGTFPNYSGTFRLPNVNQKCLADIGIEHFSSNANLRPAPIDSSTAASVVSVFLGDEGDLGPPTTFFANTDLNFTYTPDPDGFIVSYTFTGTAATTTSTQVYRNVVATGGTGTGAIFTVVRNTDQTYSLAITQKGSGYVQGDQLVIPFTSVGGSTSANNIIITVAAVGNSLFQGSITGQQLIGGFDLKPVYVVPRKLGRDHMPQHFHPGQYETINKNDASDFPGAGVGIWDNPQIRILETYRQSNGSPEDSCIAEIGFGGPDGPPTDIHVGNYWGDQTGSGANNNVVTLGAPNFPYDTGYGKYALGAILGTKPARTHTPIETTAVAHGVGKAWFTQAKKLRTRLSDSASYLNTMRTTGRIDVNTILPFADDVSLIKQPNYDDGTNGSDQQFGYTETLFNNAATKFTTTTRADNTVFDVIETHNHEGEFNIIYDPGSLNINSFITAQAEPNVTPENIPNALQIAFTLTSPSLSVTNLIRAY
jgi:hypothetical protein